jgi:hypothetical protein
VFKIATFYHKENFNLDGILKSIEGIGATIMTNPPNQVWDELMDKTSKD